MNRAERILYLTASFGPELPKEDKPAPYPHVTKFICYTEISRSGDHLGWEFCHFTAEEQEELKNHIWNKGSTRPNVIKARFVKSQFYRLSAVVAYRPTVVCWIDGNIQLVADHFHTFFARQLDNCAVVTYPHHFLKSAHADVEYASQHSPYLLKRYATEPIKEQIDAYSKDGYTAAESEKDHYLCSGVLAVRLFFDEEEKMRGVTTVLDAWWQEILTWTIHDQVGLAYVLWKRGVKHGMITDGAVTGSSAHWFWHHQ